ncbi:membrane protein DedA with SNARE-associated domain [Geobacillus thermodenitrificans]|nr:membrane protein DedA with SNARE-associated domain [Geobacillus thermodenitrificans]
MWVAVFLTIGTYFESRWMAVRQYIDAYRPILFSVFLAVFIFTFFYWHAQQKQKPPD